MPTATKPTLSFISFSLSINSFCMLTFTGIIISTVEMELHHCCSTLIESECKMSSKPTKMQQHIIWCVCNMKHGWRVSVVCVRVERAVNGEMRNCIWLRLSESKYQRSALKVPKNSSLQHVHWLMLAIFSLRLVLDF